MRCENCGAQLPEGRTVCQYCGSAWDRGTPGPAPSRRSGGNRFEQIRQSAAWADRHSAARRAGLPQMPALATVAPMIFLVVFIGVAGFMALSALGMAGVFGALGWARGGPFGAGISIVPAFFAILPIGFVALGIFMLITFRKRMHDFQNAPIEARAAVIAGKRAHVSGSSSSPSTHYFITAEFDDGRRQEFAAMTPELFAKVGEGDAGVLFTRSSYAIDFDRVVDGE